MTGAEAIAAIGAEGGSPLITQLGQTAAPEAASQLAQADFQSVLANSMQGVDAKLEAADELVRQFAVDESIPVHQVTLALEEARLSVELAMQVRARLVETYREFMTMQL